MQRITKAGETRQGSEDGNLIIASMIIFVVTALGSVIAAQAVGNQSAVVTRQNVDAAVSAADAGLADALFRLDQGTTGTGAGNYFCVNSNGASPDPNCAAGSVPGVSGVSYVANKVSATKWVINSVGRIGTKSAAVQETVTRSAMYPFALFGNTALTFNGDSAQAFSIYDDTRPASASSGNPNPNLAGNVAIGSNGTITCNGGIGANVQAVYYGTGGIGSTQNTGCGNTQNSTSLYYLAKPTAPTNASSCPNNGNLGSGIPGAPSVLTAGTYLCTIPVTMSGNLTVSGPVQLYIILDPLQYGTTTNALTIKAGSYINDLSDYCVSVGCAGPPVNLPVAANLEIFSNSTGGFGNDNGLGYYFGGVIYAPYASLTQDGCKSQYYGSLVINTLTCNGGPHLWVSYDNSLGSLYGPWQASGFTQVNAAGVSIP